MSTTYVFRWAHWTYTYWCQSFHPWSQTQLWPACHLACHDPWAAPHSSKTTQRDSCLPVAQTCSHLKKLCLSCLALWARERCASRLTWKHSKRTRVSSYVLLYSGRPSSTRRTEDAADIQTVNSSLPHRAFVYQYWGIHFWFRGSQWTHEGKVFVSL